MTTHFRTSHPRLVVCDATRAGHLLMSTTTRPFISAIISISDAHPEKRPPREALRSLPALRLTFDDTERESAAPRGPYDTPASDEDPPERMDVEKALAFARGYAEGMLVVHCFAGRSRSTAIALAIIADRVGSQPRAGAEQSAEQRAMSILLTCCERAPLPNMLIVRYADIILARNGALVRVAQHQNAFPEPAEAERDRPVTGTALLAAIKRGDL